MTRLLVHSAFEEYDVLIDRTTKYGNRYWEFGCTNDSSTDEKVNAYSRQLISDLSTGKLSLWDVYYLKDKVLGCHCCTPNNPDANCHGRVLQAFIPIAENELRKSGLLTTDNRRVIKQFQGNYRFLSNFQVFRNHISYCGKLFNSVECAYQYSKYVVYLSMHPGIVETNRLYQFELLSPSDAKKFTKHYRLPNDVIKFHDTFKIDIMRNLVESKFSTNQNLKSMLLGTEDWELQEGNYWKDYYWGIDLVSGEGQNHLGKILMEVRDKLRGNQ